MPVNPVVPTTIEVRVHFVLANAEEMINVHNVEAGATVLDATLAQDLADAYEATWTTNLQSHVSTSVLLDKIVVTDLRTANGPQFTITVGAEGLDATNPLPAQIAAVVRWTTNTRGRSYRGRTYLGGFCEDDSAGQNMSVALTSDLNTFATSLPVSFSSALGDMVIVSRYHQVVPGTPPTVPRVTNITTPVTGSYVDLYWHTHRSRAVRG